MTSEQRQNRITTIFILLSLLLHLLFLLIPKQLLMPVSKTPEPVYVEVRPPQPKDRELDLPIRKELEKPRKKPAKRLAEKDQVVEKETAPEGKDFEDRKKVVRSPQPAPKPVPPVPPTQKPADKAAEKQQPTPVTPEGWQAKPKEKALKELPDLAALTNISPNTYAKIETDWRRKFREDVEKGDTVFMDTEQDLLHNFMQRFRDNIYLVWNYPTQAVQLNQQGTCLVRITVDRKGSALNIELLESSGYDTLDQETVRAIRKAAKSYNPLPRAYPNEDLKIIAYFQYNISNVRTVKRRRPGDIF